MQNGGTSREGRTASTISLPASGATGGSGDLLFASDVQLIDVLNNSVCHTSASFESHCLSPFVSDPGGSWCCCHGAKSRCDDPALGILCDEAAIYLIDWVLVRCCRCMHRSLWSCSRTRSPTPTPRRTYVLCLPSHSLFHPFVALQPLLLCACVCVRAVCAVVPRSFQLAIDELCLC